MICFIIDRHLQRIEMSSVRFVSIKKGLQNIQFLHHVIFDKFKDITELIKKSIEEGKQSCDLSESTERMRYSRRASKCVSLSVYGCATWNMTRTARCLPFPWECLSKLTSIILDSRWCNLGYQSVTWNSSVPLVRRRMHYKHVERRIPWTTKDWIWPLVR